MSNESSEHFLVGAPREPIRRRAHYDVRRASQSYSNAGAMLAGFALTAVVLVAQAQEPEAGVAMWAALRDLAAGSLLVGFFGCVLATFTFAVVAGEEILAPRSHAMAFRAGVGFAGAALFLFFGVTVVTTMLLPGAVTAAYLIFSLMLFVIPLFLTTSLEDLRIAFPKVAAYDDGAGARATKVGYGCLLAGLIVRLCGFGLPTHGSVLTVLAVLGFGFMAFTAWRTLRLSFESHTETGSLPGFFVITHAILSALLVMALP